MSHPTRVHRLVTAVALVVLAAACGHRESTEELVRANSKVLQSQAAVTPGGTGPADESTPSTTAAGAGSADGAATSSDNDVSGGAAASAKAGNAASSAGGGGAAGGDESVGTPGESGPIVIGSVGNYSGIAGPPQAPMAKAVQVWAEFVNSNGGLFGRRVQVIVVDDRGDPAQHVAALKDLVENRHVVAFVSNAAALTIQSGRQYLESVGVPVIGTACANTTEFTSPIFFPQCEELGNFLVSQLAIGVKYGGVAPKLGFVSCSEAQTCADARNVILTQGGAKRAGMNIVYQAQASLAQPDFTSECRGAQSAGAEMMYVLLDPTGVIRFGQSCARQGYNPVYVQGSATVFYNTKDQPGLARMITGSQVFPFVGTETPARRQFQDVMKSFYGKPPGPAESYGWASAKLFELAATKAARAAHSITPKTLVDALHTMSGETVGGLTVPLTFPPGGTAKPAACAFGVRAEKGQWEVVNDGQPICL